jgi:hypothetical protein
MSDGVMSDEQELICCPSPVVALHSGSARQQLSRVHALHWIRAPAHHDLIRAELTQLSSTKLSL